MGNFVPGRNAQEASIRFLNPAAACPNSLSICFGSKVSAGHISSSLIAGAGM